MKSSSSEKSQSEKLQIKLQQLSEIELTKEILIPLYKKFGFFKVEYHGGSYEEGKDLICWRKDELDSLELGVVQVKKFKPKIASSDTKSFTEVVNQLEQASEKKVPNTDGNLYYPSQVYFVTPFPVEARALHSRFEKYASLRTRQVKIIDGQKLAGLVLNKLPKIANHLLGSHVILHEAVEKTLNNNDLMRALSAHSQRDIFSFYCDLDFAIGRISTRFLYSLNFKPVIKEFSIEPERWPSFKETCQRTENFFHIKLLTNNFEAVEQDYDNQRIQHESLHARSVDLLRSINLNYRDLDSIEKKIQNLLPLDNIRNENSLEFQLNKNREELLNILIEAKKKLKSSPYLKDKNFTHLINKIKKYHAENVKSIEEDILETSPTSNHVYMYLNVLESTNEIQKERADIRKKKIFQPPSFIPMIDGSLLVTKIQEKQKWIATKIASFNVKNPTLNDLKTFLQDCKSLFEQVEISFSESFIRESIGLSEKITHAQIDCFPRFSLSVHSLFDTGLNLAILGEAGAGKTTSLQMYAKRIYESRDESELTIFAPLVRIINTLPSNSKLHNKENISDFFVKGISFYLCTIGIDITIETLKDIFYQRRVLLLLDGIDEAIMGAHWILEGIKGLSEEYPLMRIIVSSRMSGNYLQNIPFLGITLLPFTDDQREQFLKGWFREQNTTKFELIISHLRRYTHLNEIVRNPLLATILCVLADHNIPLPDTEIQLYQERMNLLLGQYDMHRQISRLTSHPNHLKLVSRKLGYILHKNSKRYAATDILIGFARKALKDRLTDEQIETTVTELIDPCNILMPMTADGQLGFGHLRHQEYLAAVELAQNRSISIHPLVSVSWWRGALILFAQMADEIEFVISWFARHNKISHVIPVLREMVDTRPKKEQFALREILQQYSKNFVFDSEDSYWLGFDQTTEEFDEETLDMLSALDDFDDM